jgi:hypothetical protein
VSAVDTGRPDTIAVRPRFRNHRGHCRSVQAAAARRAADTLVWTAARVEVVLPPWTLQAAGVYCRRRRGVHGRSAAGDRHVPALLRGTAAVSAAESSRPAVPGRNPGRPADTAAVSGSVDTLGSGPGQRGRQTSAVQLCDRGRSLAATRNLQAAGTVDTCDCAAGVRGHCGMGRRTLRQRPAGQPTAEPSAAACMSSRERERKARHRPAPPWPDRQIRSLVLCVDLVGSRRDLPYSR